jgi:hypothetical protein
VTRPGTGRRPRHAASAHKWEFKARFRRHAFGWKSQPAIQRVKQATSEIRKAARNDPVLAAEGAVILIERLSPAIEHVDGSSGAIGAAVNRAIAQLVPLIVEAPADAALRDAGSSACGPRSGRPDAVHRVARRPLGQLYA